MENDKSLAIRNRYWKGCTVQGIFHYQNQSGHLCLFEGIFDLLSFVEMGKGSISQPAFVVLDSLANLKGAMSEIKKYSRMDLYQDWDN